MLEIIEDRIVKHNADLDHYQSVLKRWDMDSVVFKTTQRSIIISTATLGECLLIRDLLTKKHTT